MLPNSIHSFESQPTGVGSSINNKVQGHLEDRWATVFFYSCPAIFEVPLYLIIDRTSDSCAQPYCLFYPLANEVAKGYSNATVHPSFLLSVTSCEHQNQHPSMDFDQTQYQSEIPLPSDGFFRLAVAVGCRRALHTENSGFALQLWVNTFPRFVAIGFYFLSETLI